MLFSVSMNVQFCAIVVLVTHRSSTHTDPTGQFVVIIVIDFGNCVVITSGEIIHVWQ